MIRMSGGKAAAAAGGLLAAVTVLTGCILVGDALASDSKSVDSPQGCFICRANLEMIANAETEFFDCYGHYGDAAELSNSGILIEAVYLRCPADISHYCYTIDNTPGMESYTVECQNSLIAGSHGSITDGVPSWLSERNSDHHASP